MECRFDWTQEEIREMHDRPLLDLIFQAAAVHRKYHHPLQIQACSLLSIKTGGCPEDCSYCPQAARYHTTVKAAPMMEEEEILRFAKRAIENWTTRICLGAAWRSVRDGPQFDRVVEIVKKLAALGVEVCCCLGMITGDQAERLKQAGLYAYNHNLDTSPEFYSTIITTRAYEDRLKTLDEVEKAGLSVCCGGIIGMGETIDDRIGLICTLARRNPHPDSVPINLLVAVEGTPLEQRPPVKIWEFIRMVAAVRMTMPKAMIRLSAGRLGRTWEEQALCFLAGANSIFTGERLLTRPNPSFEEDREMLHLFGLTPLRPFTGES